MNPALFRRPAINTNTAAGSAGGSFVPPTTPYGTPGSVAPPNTAGVIPGVGNTVASNIGGRTTPPTPGSSGESQFNTTGLGGLMQGGMPPMGQSPGGGAGKLGPPQQGTPGIMNTGGGKGTGPAAGGGKGV